jgi:hypothetical protein
MLEFEPTIRQRRRFGVFLLSAYRELRTVYPGGFESETSHGTMVYMSPESWDHVGPHVARLLELETELAIASES